MAFLLVLSIAATSISIWIGIMIRRSAPISKRLLNVTSALGGLLIVIAILQFIVCPLAVLIPLAIASGICVSITYLLRKLQQEEDTKSVYVINTNWGICPLFFFWAMILGALPFGVIGVIALIIILSV